MGRIINTSSTNTPDTNTSRKEVKITHTHTHKTQTYKYTMKITGLIASTMLLLMASAPSGLLASSDGQPSIVPVEEIELSLSSYWKTGIKGRRIQQETHWRETHWTHANPGRRWRRRGRTLKAQIIELFRFS